MIESFDDKLAQALFNDQHNPATRKFPAELRRVAQRKLQYIHAAVKLEDLKSPPGNRLESFKGNLKSFYSIRINDQWRVVFKGENNGAHDVKIVDYH